MVAFNSAGGDGASMGDDQPDGEQESLSVRDHFLRFQERLAEILEQTRESQSTLRECQQKSKLTLPDEYRNNPEFADVVRCFDLQAEQAQQSMAFAINSSATLESWLLCVRALFKTMDPHIS